MAPMYSIISRDDEQFVTVIVDGQPYVAANTHPNYDRIVAALLSEDPDADFMALFDTSADVAERFLRLSDRVSVANGHVYFDGDLVDGSCENQIVRFLDEGVGDWQPLVRFMENVAANPTEHSRTQLYDWLNAHDFTITPEGNIVGYKGVVKQDDGSLVSKFTGHAIVNGETVNGHIPNAVGSIVEMPRSEVTHDPSEACSTGLHVGTYDYARSWASGAMLRVDVNPRDVVSVPTDASGRKVRVCRYTVKEVIDAPVNTALADYDYSDDYDYVYDGYDYDDDDDCYEQGWDDYRAGRGGITANTSDDYDEGWEDARAADEAGQY